MKLRLLFAFLLTAGCLLRGQNITLPAASPRAEVAQVIGITKVAVDYSRPSVNGREIWGALVPYGLNDLGYGSSTAAPWRAGADINTSVSFAHDVTVGDQALPAGRYGLHLILTESGEVTAIFSKDADAWGSFFYDPARDAARVTTHWEDAPFHEQLTYTFDEVTKTSATLALSWETKRIPLAITVDTDAIIVANLKRELTTVDAWDDRAYTTAAGYLIQNDLDLNLALEWATLASSQRMGQQPTFGALSTQSLILQKLGREEEATAAMDQALPMGTAGQIHQYGRQLIGAERPERALEVFQLNARLHPDVWPVNYGLARGYSAVGNFPAAIEALTRAQQQVPVGDNLNGSAIAANLEKLKRGEDIN